jgi:L-asparaginase
MKNNQKATSNEVSTSPSVHIITTGGTFDKEYDWRDGSLSFKGQTNVYQMLERVNSMVPVTISSPLAKDSLVMTPEDRQIVAKLCQQVEEKFIVVTHGTDTMVQTAEAIARLRIAGKTIVLTGAMRPWSIGESDAEANLAAAVVAAQIAAPGVWVCMNLQLLPWDDVKKDYENGWFTRVSDPATKSN